MVDFSRRNGFLNGFSDEDFSRRNGRRKKEGASGFFKEANNILQIAN